MTRRAPRARAAFTITELLVVILVVMIAMSFALPTMRGIVGGGRLATAMNQVSSGLRLARAIAMREGVETALLIRYTDTNPAGEPVQRFTLRVVRATGVDPNRNHATGFTYPDEYAERYPPQRLPRGVELTTPGLGGSAPDLADLAELRAYDKTAPTLPALAIRFAPDGSMTDTNAYGSAELFFDDDYTGNLGEFDGDDYDITPTPYLVAYDLSEQPVDEGDRTFLGNNPSLSIVAVNRYSGQAFRGGAAKPVVVDDAVEPSND